jgi:hypothetical protein
LTKFLLALVFYGVLHSSHQGWHSTISFYLFWNAWSQIPLIGIPSKNSTTLAPTLNSQCSFKTALSHNAGVIPASFPHLMKLICTMGERHWQACYQLCHLYWELWWSTSVRALKWAQKKIRQCCMATTSTCRHTKSHVSWKGSFLWICWGWILEWCATYQSEETMLMPDVKDVHCCWETSSCITTKQEKKIMKPAAVSSETFRPASVLPRRLYSSL